MQAHVEPTVTFTGDVVGAADDSRPAADVSGHPSCAKEGHYCEDATVRVGVLAEEALR